MEKIWLKNYLPGVPETINPDQYTSLTALLEDSMQRHALRDAFQHMGCALTYHDMAELSQSVGAYLQSQLGLVKGDRIAIMMPNCLQYPVILFAALRAGYVVVNVNPLYTADELSHQLNDAECQVLFVLSNFAHTVQQALPKLSLKEVIVTELGDLFPAPKSWAVNFAVKHLHKLVPDWKMPHVTLNKVLKRGKYCRLSPVFLCGADLAFLQYTGGTTGVSKGAMLTHRNIVANILQAEVYFKPFLGTAPQTVITPLPLYHIFSLVANCFWFFHQGGRNVLITNPRDIPEMVSQIKDIPFTAFTGVNTLYSGLLQNREFCELDFSHLRLSVAGGMAVHPKTAERWQKVTGVVLSQGYGLTETSPIVSANPTNITEFTDSIGMPLPSTEVSIRDDAGRELGVDETGELWIRGPQVMRGYWRQPEETRDVLTEDGWLQSGDIAAIDEKGYLRILDRKKDMILVSGFNVYPNEVEAVIAAHAGVMEVGVVGLPAGEKGETVKAFIVKRDPLLQVEDVLSHCRQHLTGYKIPHEIEFIAALPKTPVGKILRRALR